MQKFIVTINIGYGEEHDIVEAETQEMADDFAYEMAREAFENSADYGSEPYSKKRAVELGLEDEDEDAA